MLAPSGKQTIAHYSHLRFSSNARPRTSSARPRTYRTRPRTSTHVPSPNLCFYAFSMVMGAYRASIWNQATQHHKKTRNLLFCSVQSTILCNHFIVTSVALKLQKSWLFKASGSSKSCFPTTENLIRLMLYDQWISVTLAEFCVSLH